jgi:hypothetical protein
VKCIATDTFDNALGSSFVAFSSSLAVPAQSPEADFEDLRATPNALGHPAID